MTRSSSHHARQTIPGRFPDRNSRRASANCPSRRRPASSAAAATCWPWNACSRPRGQPVGGEGHASLRRLARPGRRRQNRARRGVRPLDGALAANPPRRVCLGRNARPRSPRCSMPWAASWWGRSTRSRRSTIWKRPFCRFSALSRAGDVIAGGRHGEHPPAALSRR